MKFLFDENISPRLVSALADLYPDSIHVRDVALERGEDEAVWTHARENDLVIVSKDADFHQRSFVFGHPPKVVWIRKGNCSTRDIEGILRRHHSTILDFDQDEEGAFLELE